MRDFLVGDDEVGEEEEFSGAVTMPCSTGMLGADMAAEEESDCTVKAAAASEVDEADMMLLDANAAADARTPIEETVAPLELLLDDEKSGLGSMTLLAEDEDEESSVW